MLCGIVCCMRELRTVFRLPIWRGKTIVTDNSENGNSNNATNTNKIDDDDDVVLVLTNHS
jgi:hypothetical protein